MHFSSHSCKDVIGSKPQEKFEFEVVDEGLVNFNHHFSKKLQLESKDLFLNKSKGQNSRIQVVLKMATDRRLCAQKASEGSWGPVGKSLEPKPSWDTSPKEPRARLCKA